MISFFEYFELLNENVKSRAARYNMMFSKLLKQHGDEFKLGINKLIIEAIVKLKKDNVVVFILQTLKKMILKYLERGDDDLKAFAKSAMNIRSYIKVLEHYLSLPISEIQGYN